VTDNGKQSSLLRYGNNYYRNKFYSTGHRDLIFLLRQESTQVYHLSGATLYGK
jgi:hypothetical protein